ncbi:putative deoxyribonuclease YabD [Candidatus Clavichlamydia salmonicola]|uniref:TatD family hydrolase n=1 Tax=Candidatus Clavichlamydia salmonicola TaxID=469812 RepID=UPI001891A3BF|nr:TatD family hydrolase [Candidatus Clavichlamydia salmonicola]MBF5050597.1 putative deoxyribonuclease YabD [Candidatus Clavichlamydia salmonicola]
MIVDAHAHLTDLVFETDIIPVLERASVAGVEIIINVATNKKEVEDSKKLAKAADIQIPLVAGPIPQNVLDYSREELDYFELLAKEKKIVGVGEIGLDYRPEMLESIKELQKDLCGQFLEIAALNALPVVIHCRDAFADFFSLLERHYLDDKGNTLPGMLHCFTGSYAEGMALVERGWYLSFSGILTFKNRTEELKQLVKDMPLNQLLVETDAPYLAPTLFRHKRNESAFITHIIDKMAEVRGVSVEEIAAATSQNAQKLFNLF